MGNGIIALLLFAGFAALITRLIVNSKNSQSRCFKAAAERLGLESHRPSLFSSRYIEGMLDGRLISIRSESLSDGSSSHSVIAYSCNTAGFSDAAFEIAPVDSVYTGWEDESVERITTGSAEFDNVIGVRAGYELQALTLLHPEARKLILSLFRSSFNSGFRICGGEIETSQCAVRNGSADDIIRQVKKLQKLADFLDRKNDQAAMLKENYLAENDAAAKIKFLEAYHRISKRLGADDELIADALNSGHGELVLLAIMFIGEEGYKYAGRVIQCGEAGLAVRLLDYLTAMNAKDCFSFLQPTHQLLDEKGKAALLKYYMKRRETRAEAFIRAELDPSNNASNQHKKWCVQALGFCGVYDSILFLHNLKKKETRLRKDIELSINRIQAAVGSGETGWLSLQTAAQGDGILSLSKETGKKKS